MFTTWLRLAASLRAGVSCPTARSSAAGAIVWVPRMALLIADSFRPIRYVGVDALTQRVPSCSIARFTLALPKLVGARLGMAFGGAVRPYARTPSCVFGLRARHE